MLSPHLLTFPQVTYSDLPAAYEPVARDVNAMPVQRDGDIVYIGKGYLRYSENPDSIAAIVVSTGRNLFTFYPLTIFSFVASN